MPTNHTSTIAIGLGKFIYITRTNRKLDFGAYVYEKTLKHAQTYDVNLPIAFTTIICGVILSQHSGILVSTDVVSKRESPLSLHYKLFGGKHVTKIVMTSDRGATSSTSNAGILSELKEMSKTLEETISPTLRGNYVLII